jgi:hypothetical protein
LVLPAQDLDAGEGVRRLVLALCLWLPGADRHSHGGRTGAGRGAPWAGVMWIAIVLSFVSFCVALWAFWIAIAAAIKNQALELRIVQVLQRAEDEEVARTTALELLDHVMLKRTEELKTATAKIEALRHQYETSIAIDGPLGSKRVQ